jgi:hypothetical protein
MLAACATPSSASRASGTADAGQATPIGVRSADPLAADSGPLKQQETVVDVLDDGTTALDGVRMAVAAVDDALARARNDTVVIVFRAGANTASTQVLDAIGATRLHLKGRRIVLEVRGTAPRRATLEFPERSSLPAPTPGGLGEPYVEPTLHVRLMTNGKLEVDSRAFDGALRDHCRTVRSRGTARAVIMVESDVPWRRLVDAAGDAEAEGLKFAIGMAAR